MEEIDNKIRVKVGLVEGEDVEESEDKKEKEEE
jgi:recombination protein RecA